MKTACALIVAGILIVSVIICLDERFNVAVPESAHRPDKVSPQLAIVGCAQALDLRGSVNELELELLVQCARKMMK
jgi:hypothetical protein